MRYLPACLTFWTLLLVACAPKAAGPQVGPAPTAPVPLVSPVIELDERAVRVLRYDPPGAGGRMTIEIEAVARNDNPFPLGLTRLDYRLDLAAEESAAGSKALDLTLPKNGAAKVRFELAVPVTPRLAGLVGAALSGGSLPYRLALGAVVEAAEVGVEETAAQHFAGDAPVDVEFAEPSFRLWVREGSLRLRNSGRSTVALMLEARNDGDVGYLLSTRDLSLSLGAQRLAGTDLGPMAVPARATSRIDVRFFVAATGVTELIKRAIDEASRGSVTGLELRGAIRVDIAGYESFELPAAMRILAVFSER